MRDMLSNTDEPAWEAILPSGCSRDISEDMLVKGMQAPKRSAGEGETIVRDLCSHCMTQHWQDTMQSTDQATVSVSVVGYCKGHLVQ